MFSHRNIIILKWFNFFIDFRLYAPIAILYFSQVTGSFALGMSIFSITMISSALFELPTGIFSDKIGRKKTVLWGAGSAIIFSIFYAIGGNFWILAIGAVFEGLSRAFYSGNNDALLHDTLSELGQQEFYDEHLGKVSSTSQAALAIASVFGGFLATWSFTFIMWFSVFPQLACFILGLFLIEPKMYAKESTNIYSHLKQAYGSFISNKKLRLLSFSSILGYGFGEASYQFVPAFYNTLWPVWAIGLAKTMSNVLATVSFHFSGKLIRRFNALRIMLLDNITNRIIGITATAFPTILSPFLMSVTSAFYGVTTVAKNALMQKEFTSEQRATMGSLNAFAGSIFFGIIAFILGFAADSLSPAKAILMLQIFQIGNLVIYWKLFKHSSQ
jgi:MFS family permease